MGNRISARHLTGMFGSWRATARVNPSRFFRSLNGIALAVLFSALGRHAMAQAQPWKNTGIPGGARVTALWPTRLPATPGSASAQTALLAGSENGRIFRSEDGGGTWRTVMQEAGASVMAFHEFRGLLFAAAGVDLEIGLWDCWGMNCVSPTLAGGIFRSRDGGRSWTRVPLGYGAVAFASRYDSLFAATQTSLLGSADSGWTWNPVPFVGTEKPTGQRVRAIEASSQAFYFLTSGGLWLSRGLDGWKWKRVDPDAKALVRTGPFEFLASGSGTKRLSGSGSETIVSTMRFNRLSVSGDSLIGFTDSLIWTSIDGGAAWKPFPAAPGSLKETLAGFVSGNRAFMGGLDWEGVKLLAADGSPWVGLNQGMHDWVVNDLLVKSGNVFAAHGQGGFRILDSGSGKKWARGFAAEPAGFMPTVLGALNGLPAAAGSDYSIAVSRSEGRAGTWERSVFPHPSEFVVPAGFASGSFGSGFFNNGTGFDFRICSESPVAACRPTLMQGFPKKTVNTSSFIQTNAFAGVAAQGRSVAVALEDMAYRSLDGGDSWSALKRPPGPPRFLAYLQGVLWMGTRTDSFGNPGSLYAWDEGESTWKPAPGGNFNGTLWDVAVRAGAEAFLATDDGLYRKGLWDTSWTDIGSGLPVRGIRAVAVDGNLLAAGLDNGEVWTLDLEPPTGIVRAAGFQKRTGPGVCGKGPGLGLIPDGRGRFLRVNGAKASIPMRLSTPRIPPNR